MHAHNQGIKMGSNFKGQQSGGNKAKIQRSKTDSSFHFSWFCFRWYPRQGISLCIFKHVVTELRAHGPVFPPLPFWAPLSTHTLTPTLMSRWFFIWIIVCIEFISAVLRTEPRPITWWTSIPPGYHWVFILNQDKVGIEFAFGWNIRYVLYDTLLVSYSHSIDDA